MEERVESLQKLMESIAAPITLIPKEFIEEMRRRKAEGKPPLDFKDPKVIALTKAFGEKQEPSADEVYPHLYVGNKKSVETVDYLKSKQITHVVNMAEGDFVASVNPDVEAYKDNGISYYGVKCDDTEDSDISVYFNETAEYIDKSLAAGGTVVVNCFAGISRSTTTAVSFLMQMRGLGLEEALVRCRQKRDVRPNPGFLIQLIQLEGQLVQTTD